MTLCFFPYCSVFSPAKAYEVYAEGAERGTLNSMYQRSTYNAPNLKAQPWWTPEETPYAKDIKRIEKNWKTIRDEGLSVLGLKQGTILLSA